MIPEILNPVSDLTSAERAAAHAARATLPLLRATLLAQFPGAHFLILTRSAEDDELRLDSVRDAHGGVLWDYPWNWRGYQHVQASTPAQIAALWGDDDPQDPAVVLDLVDRIDRFARVAFLPGTAMRGEEESAERTPLGVPLTPAAGATQA
ncbi:hypothetical protein ACFXKW_26495 [Streptomyces sp. NPDC059193]|uniref:hypothetical protein n=1 Tax=Streptomyces sp. NPDC059193 TaxID=3346763 RepID=UPI0036BBED49